MDKGAHYHKCDFQVHTPRDINWSGTHYTSEEERKTFSTKFIKQCRNKGLDAVAITDHHDFAFFKYIKAAAKSELDELGNVVPPEKQIIVFPGLEMTFANPASCQAILILDSDFSEAQLNLILHKLSIIPNADSESTTIPTSPISSDVIKDLTDLHVKLDSLEVLRAKFIVLPNVGEGHGSILRRGFYEHYIKMPCVGGYVDGAMPTHPGHLRKVNGGDVNYGNKAIGVFQTSDNRREDGLDLGMHSTWVKWAEPTAEALRQACLSKESRISLTEPELPQIFIRSINVTASKFLGSFDIALNRQYNALIGGRGSGKSTILEYLRWGLCDQPVSVIFEDDELSSIQKKRIGLINKTLTDLGGEVRVTLVLNSIPHIIKRKGGSREILIKIGLGDFKAISEDEVRKLLPIQAYSQKQLSDVGIRKEELKRLIEQPIHAELSAQSFEIAEIAKSTREIYTKFTTKKEVEKEISNLNVEAESLRFQVSNYRNSIKGLSGEDKLILDQKNAYDTEEIIILNLKRELEHFQSKATELRNDLKFYPEPLGETEVLANKELIQSLSDEVDKKFAEIKVAAASLEKVFISEKMSTFNQLIAEWEVRKTKFDAAYLAAQNSVSKSQTQLQEIQRREVRLHEVEKLLNERRAALKGLGNPEDGMQLQKQKWLACHQKKVDLLSKEALKLEVLSNNQIKVEVSNEIEVAPLKELLKSMFEGTRIREDRITALLHYLKSSTDPLTTYQEFLEEFRLIAEHKHAENSAVPLPVALILNACDFSEDHLAKLCNKISANDWLRLATIEVEFNPKFYYRTDNELDDKIQFEDASAGQQATALLSVLLNQEGAPLIIDQPEDDIDNKAMDDIIKNIWIAKKKRQLIFASHNANLVVNGDAELVICFGYRDASSQTHGEIKCEGAIDTKQVREEITSVMEGGEKAFRLRKEKYGY
jgi:chromosome segregation protein